MNPYRYRIAKRDPWLYNTTFPDPPCNKGVPQSEHLGVMAFEPCPGGCDLGFAAPVAAPESITAVVSAVRPDDDNGACYCCGSDPATCPCSKEPCDRGGAKFYCMEHCGHLHDDYHLDVPDVLEVAKAAVEQQLVEAEWMGLIP